MDDMTMQIILEAVNESFSAFDSLNQSMDTVQASVETLTRTLDGVAKNVETAFEQAAVSVESLNAPMDEEAKKLMTLFDEPAQDAKKQLESIASGLNNITSEATTQADDLITQMIRGEKGAFDELQKVAAGMDNIDTEASKQADDLITQMIRGEKGAFDELQKVASGLDNISTEAEKQADAMTHALGQAATQAHQQMAGASGAGAGGGASGHGANHGQMSNDLMYGGMTMGAAALPIVAGMKDAISTFADFDQAVANVNSMLGDTPTQVEALKNQLIELSKTVPDGPTALANALYSVVGAGVPAKDAMSVLTTASKAAAAGQTDVSTATSALIAVMDSYGMSADQVGKISDQMFAANAAGAMTFTDFAKSIGNIAGPAAQVGISFDQVAAATAALTNQGLSAQRATFGLRALLMGIAAPTAGATKEAAKLGIQWDETTLKQKGLVGMMQEAMKATGGNAEELKKLIPNIAAWTVATDLGGKGADSYTQAMKTMADASGATDKAMKAQEEGLSQQTDHLKASFQSAQILFVQSFAPALSLIVDHVNHLLQAFNNLNPHTKEALGIFIAITGGLLLFAGTTMMMLSGIGQAIEGFKALSEVFKTVAASEALMDALNPTMWIVLAIVAVAALAAVIIAYWDKIVAALKAGATWIQANLGINIPQIWNALKTTAETVFHAIGEVFGKVWGSIKQVVSSVMAYVEPSIKNGVNRISAYWKSIWPEVREVFEGVWNAIKTFFAPIVAVLYVIISGFIGMVKGAWEPFWKAMSDYLKMIWDVIKGVFSVAFDIIGGAFKVFLDLLTGHWSKAWDDVKQMGQNFVDDITTMLKNLGNDALSFGKNFMDMFTQGIENGISAVKNAVSKVANTVKSFLGFHSPTEEGAASDSDQWAPNFVKMFAGGLVDGVSHVRSAANALISPLGTAMGGNALSPIASAPILGGGASGGATIYNITVHASGNVAKNERELGKTIAGAIVDQAKSQAKFSR